MSFTVIAVKFKMRWFQMYTGIILALVSLYFGILVLGDVTWKRSLLYNCRNESLSLTDINLAILVRSVPIALEKFQKNAPKLAEKLLKYIVLQLSRKCQKFRKKCSVEKSRHFVCTKEGGCILQWGRTAYLRENWVSQRSIRSNNPFS